jgi:ecotin
MKGHVMAALMFLLVVSSALAADNMKAFPPAGEGMVRYVLHLPELTNESDFKVELIVGKTVEIDAQNQYFLVGDIEAETIVGWGFTRYLVRKVGPIAGTLMAVDPDAPKVARFVTLGGEPYLVRYNSRVPVVIYVPEGVEVRYRVWSAEGQAKTLETG